jgi:molybdopterin-guanine dinucleotide biosynthesis protein A
LRTQCPRLLIAPGTLDASGWLEGAGVAPDVLPVRASITGIHAAISGATTDVVAVAWDMPFVPPSLIAAMIARAGGSANWSAVVPVVDGRPEPLCAAYSPRAAEPIADAVRRGLLRNGDILATLPDVIWLDEAFLKPFGDPAVMFFNVNAPSDLTRAEEIARTM